jgi:hypothetical protein
LDPVDATPADPDTYRSNKKGFEEAESVRSWHSAGCAASRQARNETEQTNFMKTPAIDLKFGVNSRALAGYGLAAVNW